MPTLLLVAPRTPQAWPSMIPPHHPTHLALTGTVTLSSQMGPRPLWRQVPSLLKSSLGVAIQVTPPAATPKTQASVITPILPSHGPICPGQVRGSSYNKGHMASGGNRIPLLWSEGTQGGGSQPIKQLPCQFPAQGGCPSALLAHLAAPSNTSQPCRAPGPEAPSILASYN